VDMSCVLIRSVWMACVVGLSNAVICYDCRSDDSTCNVGQCHGVMCLKMETSNMGNERKTVHKSCSNEMEPTQCRQSGFGSKLITRCSCDSDYCNGDELLHAAGLQKASSTQHKSLLIYSLFICLVAFFRRDLLQIDV